MTPKIEFYKLNGCCLKSWELKDPTRIFDQWCCIKYKHGGADCAQQSSLKFVEKLKYDCSTGYSADKHISAL